MPYRSAPMEFVDSAVKAAFIIATAIPKMAVKARNRAELSAWSDQGAVLMTMGSALVDLMFLEDISVEG